jgi:glycosyltransferase 2 family protein
LAGKVYGFLHTMLEGARSVFKLSQPWLFLLYTCLIWAVLIFMNFCFLKALPETQDLGWYMATLILFIGGLGWALPVPGGMGTTHFIVLQLFLAFGLSETAGQNIALLSNGATFVFTILFGFVAYGLFAGLLVQQKQSKADSEPTT